MINTIITIINVKDQQYYRYRVSVSKTDQKLRAHLNGLVAYHNIV
jgi:hypothetical protein